MLIRAILVPLTYRQLKSMQEMQRLAPEINKLKEKYKDDKQRQQQEIMKFYQENKINPLASCLPLLLQLPVFISLFYMLRTDLKLDICGQQLREFYTRELHKPIVSNSQIPQSAVTTHAGHTVKGLSEIGCNMVAPGSAKFLFIPDITAKATGVALVVLILLYVGSQLASTFVATATADPNQRRLMLLLPRGLRGDPLPLSGRTARLLDHDEPVDGRPAAAHPPAHGPSATKARDVQGLLQRQAERRRSSRRSPAPAWARRMRPQRRERRIARRLRAAGAAAQEEETLGQAAMSDDEAAGGADPAEELDPVDALEELLEEIADGLGLEVEVEVESGRDALFGRLQGEDVGLFIGRHGQTIDAVQHLAQRIVFPEGPAAVRVVIDANGYRERRAEALRAEADDAADAAVRRGEPVELDPLPPFERRIVHEYLRERGDVETHSEGEEPEALSGGLAACSLTGARFTFFLTVKHTKLRGHDIAG